LSEQNKQQVIALGRLGWSLRRIQRATGVRRETAAGYLKAAGIAFRPPGKWGRAAAKPANEVITDSALVNAADPINPEPPSAKPANGVITDFGAELGGHTAASDSPPPGRSPTASACEPYLETIELGRSRGRNAMAIWQDLVDTCGFAGGYQSVRRFVRQLRPNPSPEARVVIETAVGEECQVDYGWRPARRSRLPKSRVGPVLTKCRPGRDKRRAGLGRLQLSVPAAIDRTGLSPLPHRSENAKTACIMGVFRGFEAASEELLTRLTGFRADCLTPQVNHDNRPLVNRFGRGTGADRGAFGGSSVEPMDSDARRCWGRKLSQHHHFSLYS